MRKVGNCEAERGVHAASTIKPKGANELILKARLVEPHSSELKPALRLRLNCIVPSYHISIDETTRKVLGDVGLGIPPIGLFISA